MKMIILLFAIMVSTGCTQQSISEPEQIAAYYKGFQNSDFSKIKSTLADSVTLVEGSYEMKYSREGFREHFAWDSVFKPEYKVIKIESVGDHQVAEISVSSSRFRFLKNNPLVSRQQFYFKNGQINRIENVGFIQADWEAWNTQKEALISYVAIHHQELDGFINDLSKQGALNYLKAIELFEKRSIKN